MRFSMCFFLLFLLLTVPSLSAQIVLQQINEKGIVTQKQSIVTDMPLLDYVKLLTDSMQYQGFLEYAVDSIKSADDKTYLFIHQGPLYYWRTIQRPSTQTTQSAILFDFGNWETIIRKNIGKPATMASRDWLLNEKTLKPFLSPILNFA